VDVFLFLMDYMVKRCTRGKLRIGIRIKEKLDGSVSIRMEGDFKAPSPSSIKILFTDMDPVSGGKKGKLTLCRSIVQRFGGSIDYFSPQATSTYKGGGFNVELREANQ
jgi:hypothetical protein